MLCSPPPPFHTNLQVKNQEKPEEERRKAGRQPINMLGIVLMAVGAILDSIAFGFAPQVRFCLLSLVSPALRSEGGCLGCAGVRLGGVGG